LGGRFFEVEERLVGELGDNRIGVAQEKDQEPQPGELVRVDSDDGQGAGHFDFTQLFGSCPTNLREWHNFAAIGR
jgi:hypothetical protein